MLTKLNQFFSKIFNTRKEPAPDNAAQPDLNTFSVRIRDLIAKGKIEEALVLFIDNGHPEAVLLKSQYDEAQMLFNQNKIQFKEWNLVRNRICHALLNDFREEPEKPPEKHQPPPAAIPETPITEQQRAEVRQLITALQMDAAFNLCKSWGTGFLMAHSRYTTAKRMWMMGLIEEEEWINSQKQIAEAIMFSLDEHPGV